MSETKKCRFPTNSPFMKIPFGGLTSNMLRTVAIVFMLSDHIWATTMSFGNWMTYIGRMAFPIFAFQIADRESMERLTRAAEVYLTNHLERSFDTLDFYRTVKNMDQGKS